MVVHAYNTSTQEVEQEDCELKDSLGYKMRLCPPPPTKKEKEREERRKRKKEGDGVNIIKIHFL
jgi:hypothetical protein